MLFPNETSIVMASRLDGCQKTRVAEGGLRICGFGIKKLRSVGFYNLQLERVLFGDVHHKGGFELTPAHIVQDGQRTVALARRLQLGQTGKITSLGHRMAGVDMIGMVPSSLTSTFEIGWNPLGTGSLIKYIVRSVSPVFWRVKLRFAGTKTQTPLYKSAVFLPALKRVRRPTDGPQL